MLENLHKISLTSIEKAPVTQPNIYSLGFYYINICSVMQKEIEFYLNYSKIPQKHTTNDVSNTLGAAFFYGSSTLQTFP